MVGSGRICRTAISNSLGCYEERTGNVEHVWIRQRQGSTRRNGGGGYERNRKEHPLSVVSYRPGKVRDEKVPAMISPQLEMIGPVRVSASVMPRTGPNRRCAHYIGWASGQLSTGPRVRSGIVAANLLAIPNNQFLAGPGTRCAGSRLT